LGEGEVKVDDWIKFFRAITRPILTFAGWFCLCNMVYDGKEVPEFFIAAVLGMTGWYFWDRSKLHQVERDDNNKMSVRKGKLPGAEG